MQVTRRESQIVLGLDPDPAALWARIEPGADAAAAVAAAVLEHCRTLIAAVAPAVVAIKPQLACFERLGASGWAALAAVCEYAREQDLLVIADGKRGDIDVSAAAYADGLFGGLATPAGPVAGLGADAATVAPYMGADSVRPFVDGARACDGGIFVLLRTSNPGAAEIAEAELAGGRPLWERVAAMIAALDDGRGALADVGAVVGATAPGALERARELLPRAVFLLPGVGAQGGQIEQLAPAFAPGRAGGLIAVSRTIVQAGSIASARTVAEMLREQAWSLACR